MDNDKFWDLQQLRELVAESGGAERVLLLKPLLQSVGGKYDAARFHMSEAASVFEDFYQKEEVPVTTAIKALFSNGEDREKFYFACLKYEAHLVAAGYVLHSVSDIIAHVIVRALELEYAEDDRVKLQGLTRLLSHGRLRDRVVALCGLVEYRYLQDFVNINKHMSLVFANYHISTPPGSEGRHGVRFQAFDIDGRHHKEKWGQDLARDFERIATAQVEIGREINRYLSHAASS